MFDCGWHRAVRSADLHAGEIRRATAGRQVVLVARLHGGDVVAFATRCPHQDTDLRDATVWEDKIRCPRHQYQYDPRTGENVFPSQRFGPEALWKTKPGYLPVYRVQEKGGWILVAQRPLPPPSTFAPELEEPPVGAIEIEHPDGAGEGTDVPAGAAETVKVLEVEVGKTFEIQLPTNPLPGHTWVVEVGGARLELVEEGLLPVDPPRWGVRLTALVEGDDDVRCAFSQPWDVEPSERRRYVVRVVRSTGERSASGSP